MHRLTCFASVLSLCVVLCAGVGAQAQELSFAPAKGMFLVAAPRLIDPNFSKTVVLLLEANESGALGLVVNRPSTVTLGRAFTIFGQTPIAEHPVHYGGPLEPRQVYVLLRTATPLEGTQRIRGDIYVTTKVNALWRAKDEHWGANRWRAIAGYAGWAPRQLQGEIERGDWRVLPADEHSLFEVPTLAMWTELWRQLDGLWVDG